MNDQLIIGLVAFVVCLVIGGLALVGLRLTRSRSIRYSLIIAGLAPVLAVAATVVIMVWLMFLSQHDTGVVLLALAVSLLLATALALLVTRQLAAGATRLEAGISQLAGSRRSVPGPPAQQSTAEQRLPAELNAVLRELDSTRASLAEASERERAAVRARQQLVRHLSHDLRTPLAGLRAMAEALEDGMVSDVPTAMRQIRSSVGRMDSLVGDLFELSRVEGAPSPREHRLLSLTELITDVADEVGSAAQGRSVELAVAVPEEDRLALSGDPDALARAISNLVANAVRHTAPGGTVTVTADRGPDGDISVAVSDGCGGIPERDLGRVFEAGWRGDRSRSGADGAGLGLAIARGVVESHQGRIAVRNVGPGCRFDVALPGDPR